MSTIKKVVVLGAGGNVGKSIIKALLAENGRFEVTGLTREASSARLPADVQHLRSDFSQQSLIHAFQGQEAIVSTLSGGGLAEQSAIVDAAIAAGVRVFIPSEYGIDTANPAATEVVPFLKAKVAAVDYLRSKQDKISWTAVIIGALFDWGLNIPGFGGWNVPDRKVTIYDGGEIPYEATTLDQVGRGVTAILKHPDITKNNYVYINSFTITQNQLLEIFEKITGDQFAVTHDSSEQLWQSGFNQIQEGQRLGVLAQIASAFYAKGAELNLANYSKTRGLWNDRLEIPNEKLESFLKEYLSTRPNSQ
ncbi:hypothetical protein AYO21_02961 [Fonsecaea monophora]|uniref:NmrA-like domain-containing protein n=1 Tax=Fonsecaea monophora TaxID=254056 RepID=A0A177FES6_9EURO|nr:hypothetical protein AYO21_02961 [Fonsecaea monophora]OAG42678.1 hypothetical protein AYO21_02961 [Fonsecaea monophora]